MSFKKENKNKQVWGLKMALKQIKETKIIQQLILKLFQDKISFKSRTIFDSNYRNLQKDHF